MERRFHVPYCGSTETSERRAKATISLLTRLTLAVDCSSSRRASDAAADSGATVWLVTS